jgi:hypothetical protein
MMAADRMALLYRRLRERAAGADVRLLSGDQVLASRDMRPNPAGRSGGKAGTYVPGPDGYEVYVACRPADREAELAALSQRMTGPPSGPPLWDGRIMRLRVDPGELSGDWQVGDRRGGVVTVHATAGSDRVLDDVNAILSDVEAVLLP